MSYFYLDFETRSDADLHECGADVHLSHPWADVWCCGYALGDGEVHAVTPDAFKFVAQFITGPNTTIVSHNAQFEWQVWNKVLVPKYGFDPISIEKFVCTMAQGYAMALPGSLDHLSAALGIEQGKDAVGARLSKQMALPRAVTGMNIGGTITQIPVWWDEPEKLERLKEYCRQDVWVLREIHKRQIPLIPYEQKVWCLDARINDRGMAIDGPGVHVAIQIVETEQSKDCAKLWVLTDGQVNGPSEVKRLTEWIQAQGVELTSLAKQSVIDCIESENYGYGLPDNVRTVLQIRQNFAKTSTAKLARMDESKSPDGRLRGIIQYCAAATGRFGGRRAQPHNLPRPRPCMSQEDIEDVLNHLPAHSTKEAIAYMQVFYGNPLTVLADCLRGFFCAAPGKLLLAGDFANIEGRVLAWLAGERWKLKAFADYDEGIGPDLYLLAASRIYHKPVGAFTKKSPERQIGKVAELALGYQGGVGAFQTMAQGYGVHVDDSEAEDIKVAWREAHPNIKQYWYNLENAAISAMQHPGSLVSVGLEYARIKFKKAGSFLWCQLPSGRALCYPYPKLVPTVTPWGEEREQLNYKTVDDQTHQFIYTDTYGGKLAENITQAVARDILVHAMVNLDEAGYPIVLHVHDEIVAEIFGSEKELINYLNIMQVPPPWAPGLPIAVEGWAGVRYRK